MSRVPEVPAIVSNRLQSSFVTCLSERKDELDYLKIARPPKGKVKFVELLTMARAKVTEQYATAPPSNLLSATTDTPPKANTTIRCRSNHRTKFADCCSGDTLNDTREALPPHDSAQVNEQTLYYHKTGQLKVDIHFSVIRQKLSPIFSFAFLIAYGGVQIVTFVLLFGCLVPIFIIADEFP